MMPGSFKIDARRTDAVSVSETVVNETTNASPVAGEGPRLGTNSGPMLPDVPPATAFSNVDSGPTLPVVSQVLTDGSGPTLPTLPVATPTAPVPPTPTQISSDPRHPMAHLMPEKKPSEASLRAAEARAAKNKKARKVKIVVTVVLLAVTVFVGPPLARWTIDAINQAGKVQEDEPATTTPAEPPASQPAADTGSDPQATPSAGLQAIDNAQQLAATSTPPPAP
jgi:hypothetical protein